MTKQFTRTQNKSNQKEKKSIQSKHTAWRAALATYGHRTAFVGVSRTTAAEEAITYQ
jgi:hypothetical protein